MSRLRDAESIQCQLNQREAHDVGFSIPHLSGDLLHRSYPRASRLRLETRNTAEVPAAGGYDERIEHGDVNVFPG